MVKQVHGAWLPDREDYLIDDIAASPRFAGGPTVQFKKFARAFPEFRQFRHAVDIGANVGLWTRIMAACFDRVTAFEPNPETLEAFWLNNGAPDDFLVGSIGRAEWVRGHKRLALNPVALGAEPGEVRLYTKRRSTAFTRVKDDGDTPVEQRTLDSFSLTDVDFIKIDVEGWEHNVVKGGVETIRKWRPVMIVEQKPGNAELHGLKQFGAVNLLKKWGAREVANVSGDVIMAW